MSVSYSRFLVSKWTTILLSSSVCLRCSELSKQLSQIAEQFKHNEYVRLIVDTSGNQLKLSEHETEQE